MENCTALVLLSISVVLFSSVNCSEKKGICMAAKAFYCEDFKALSNVKWWYDWRAYGERLFADHSCPEEYNKYKETHIPMAWGNTGLFPNYKMLNHSKYLLAFNEPNHVKQANMTPAQAIALWPDIEKIANDRGMEIVSPSAAICGHNCTGNMTEWFDEFFRLCEEINCRVDYLATHVYKCYAHQVMKVINQLYDRYNLKIWLTEFSCPLNNSAAYQLAFLQELLPQLEASDKVFRYAWYMSRLTKEGGFVLPAVSLLEANSPVLTELGRFYNNFNEPTTTTTAEPSSNTVSTGESPPELLLRCVVVLALMATWHWVG